VISWQGSYSSDDGPHGQQNNIGFGWAFLVVAALSVIAYVIALRRRLSPAEARAQVAAVGST
jgi:hypothetical protein